MFDNLGHFGPVLTLIAIVLVGLFFWWRVTRLVKAKDDPVKFKAVVINTVFGALILSFGIAFLFFGFGKGHVVDPVPIEDMGMAKKLVEDSIKELPTITGTPFAPAGSEEFKARLRSSNEDLEKGTTP